MWWLEGMWKTKNRKTKGNTIKNIRNLFKLKNKNEVIKDRTIRDIKNLLELEEHDYKPMDCNFYVEYESNHDRNKTPPIK